MNDVIARIRCKKRNTTDEEDDALDEILRLNREVDTLLQWKKDVKQKISDLMYQAALCDKCAVREHDEVAMVEGGWIELIDCVKELSESSGVFIKNGDDRQ